MAFAVRFDDITKRYVRGGARYRSLRQDAFAGLRRTSMRLRGKRPPPTGKLALEHISFDVQEGESVALIGPNGAGKTTALKLLARITYPTTGKLIVRGRVGALIEVGSGIHLELTGRENIWLYGQILGMSKAEVRRRFDEIVEFAELSHALDVQAKMYSSGMQLRLGFAIASHIDPAIFVVDEALAVGDAGFQAKCVEQMMKFVSEGRTLIFVSHDLDAVRAACKRGLFLLDGRVAEDGKVTPVVRSYLDWVDTAHAARLTERFQPRPSSYLELTGVTFHGSDGRERYAFRTGEDVEVRLGLHAFSEIRRPHVSIGITDGRPGNLIVCAMKSDADVPERMTGDTVVSCRLDGLPLLPRVYELWCAVRSESAYGELLDWQPIGAFRVAEGPDVSQTSARSPGGLSATDGPVHVAHTWRVEPSP
jgi:ABC-type polysaccharide/polyol phosphate transport system ATPase subunit